MANPPLSDELAQQAVDAFLRHGEKQAAAVALGIPTPTFANRIRVATARGMLPKQPVDPAIQAAAEAGGIADISTLSHFWQITKDEEGNGYSLFVKNPASGDRISIADMVRNAIESASVATPLKLDPRPEPTGENLLVIDLADVHFLKLSVRSETGVEYNREVARHRVVEGTKALLRTAAPMGLARILFVLGNDILHVDTPRSTTTAGTYQDTDGTIFQGFTDASVALKEAIDEAAKVAPVDLLHCMSNHDWVIGWALSQSVGAHYGNSASVSATAYNLSERHRKYYRFGSNLLGFSHGDGAKEELLYGVMVKEAREHISECLNLYWYLHHVHHKIRKQRGENKPYLREKDHNGMTTFMTGNNRIAGEEINIEYVRSPSAPDGWHDRNGYLNRQAVECFIHHPHDGQKARFTEWF